VPIALAAAVHGPSHMVEREKATGASQRRVPAFGLFSLRPMILSILDFGFWILDCRQRQSRRTFRAFDLVGPIQNPKSKIQNCAFLLNP
jgi:hypothetical protein